MSRSLGRWLPLDATLDATAALSSTAASASVSALPASVVEAPADKTENRRTDADTTENRRTDADAGGGLFGSVRDWGASISRRTSSSWGLEARPPLPPVHLIITMMKWIRTSRFSIKILPLYRPQTRPPLPSPGLKRARMATFCMWGRGRAWCGTSRTGR